MRVILFFISFCFFIFSYEYAFSFTTKESQPADFNSSVLQQNTPHYFKNKGHKVTVVTDYTDIELEEDYHTNDEMGATAQKIFFVKSSLFSNWNLVKLHPFLLKYWSTNFDVNFYLYSPPLYIKNRVLRI